MKESKRENILAELNKYKKRQWIFIIVTQMINFVILIGIILYFKMKERAMCGYIYQNDENIGRQVVNYIFNNKINRSNINSGSDAMRASGYGSDGFSYISRINGERTAIVILIVLMVILLIAGIINCLRMGRNSVFVQVDKLVYENEQLKKALENEQQYNEKQYKKIQNFIENIAHQIKTPLSVIAMKHDLLMEWIKGNSIKNAAHYENMIAISQNNTFKIKTFIKKLLDISRLESGKVIFADDEVMIDALLLESVNNNGVGTENIIINFNDENLNIYADEGWLIECFVNIIENCKEAVKNIAEGKVFIDTYRGKDTCNIIISDNGKGLSIENFNNIFNRFETGGESSGFRTGIGLNLSKLIVDAHNGRIKAGNSEKYGGAEFRIELPVYKLKNKIISSA